jgi:hypothetical protein
VPFLLPGGKVTRHELPDNVQHKGKTYTLDIISLYGEVIYSHVDEEDEKIQSVVMIP